jgi:hypothetical protein
LPNEDKNKFPEHNLRDFTVYERQTHPKIVPAKYVMNIGFLPYVSLSLLQKPVDTALKTLMVVTTAG